MHYPYDIFYYLHDVIMTHNEGELALVNGREITLMIFYQNIKFIEDTSK